MSKQESEDYDEVRVHFSDGSSTVICVSQDDDIRDAIVEMCECEGYDMQDVTDYQIGGEQ